MTKKIGIVVIGIIVSSSYLFSQNDNTTELGQNTQGDVNVIQTPVPFINIVPDSRGGAMGDLGVATSPDNNSLHWNASKYAFMEQNIGFSTSYTPWLKNLSPDIKLLYMTFFTKIDRQSAFAGGLRYFTLGSITFTDERGGIVKKANPNEFAIDASYSRLFSEKFSGGITFRWIYSNLTQGYSNQEDVSTAGNAFAADISSYYRTPMNLGDKKSEWAWGINISNIGSKIAYSSMDKKDFIPANLRLGTALTMEMDAYNKMTFALEFNKLLVPTPPIYLKDTVTKMAKKDANGNLIILKGEDPDVSVAQGIFQSFYDAPGGFSEEMKEVMVSIGAEYWYQNQFAIRGGYFGEAAMKGNRKYFTLGAGLKMTLLSIDFSYLIPSGGRNNPLANTMRFSLNFDFGKPKKQNGR